MDKSELDRQIAEVLEKGFDESFADFCAKTFSSYSYPPENLAAARMHAFYLRFVLEALKRISPDKIECADKTFELSDTAIEIGIECYKNSLSDDVDFCREFIKEWCRHWAG